MARGMVTNDTFGPVRYVLSLGPEHRALPRTVTNQVLSGMARWSIAASPDPPPEETASQLLKRYGLVCREVAMAESVSWPAALGPLSRMEVLGAVRRGYFVHGLSGMQFALPDAVDRLRAVAAQVVAAGQAGQAGGANRAVTCAAAGMASTTPAPVALADGDPALAWGRILPWPDDLQPRPHPPSVLVTAAGRPLLAGEGRPLRLVKLAELTEDDLLRSLRSLADLAQRFAGGRLEVASFEGRPIRETPAAVLLAQLGFTAAPLTMVRYGRP